MLGLVWADSIWTLFIFWELTSVTSFLLVGHKNTDLAVRNAARRALLITGAGGLALLAGLIVMAQASGSTSLTDLTPMTGTAAAVAATLIIVGAATKSAQVPFHVWLPGAMAAPTPVSAYLHSATMVKAGVLLVAVAGPAFVETPQWKVVGVCFGVASMLWGAVGALRHRDAKLILAWGTVSQLGLLFVLLALGTAKSVFAATAMLTAHAFFKAALFLVVGEIDIRTGTRNIDELGGLARRMPIAFFVAVTAGLSMAGVPPLLGFMSKEAAVEAALQLSGTERIVVLGAIAVGAVLTVAYTTRFIYSVFGPGPETPVAPRTWFMTAPALALSLISLSGYFFVDLTNSIVRSAAIELIPSADKYSLLAWPGFTTAFNLSIGIVALGSVLGWVLARQATAPAPSDTGAQAADTLIEAILLGSKRVTGLIQHGSLPVYLATMTATATVATLPFTTELSFDHLIAWNHPIQGVLAAAIVISAVAGTFVGSRIGAALTLGAVGTGVAGLFVVHGAPDLALTQPLVETIIVVGFVVGLGHLSHSFPPVQTTWRTIRLVLSITGGVLVAGALATSAAMPSGSAPVAEVTAAAVEVGGGKNLVNVILTDLRALDTLGEVVVLATVSVGILALARSRVEQVTS